jgi:predicted nucleotidyltransferase
MKSFELNEQIIEIKDILLEVKKKLKKFYGDKFIDLILYGSYARGNAREESDVDLALILTEPVNTFKEVDNVVNIVYDLSLEYGLVLSILPLSNMDFINERTSTIRFIKEEGISI